MKKHVFIISNHIMFRHGLESLLRKEAGIEILDQTDNVTKAIEKIKECQPDVVILDTNGAGSSTEPQLFKILEAGLGIKVIGLSLSDNHLHVYQVKHWLAESVDDLVNAIKSESVEIESGG